LNGRDLFLILIVGILSYFLVATLLAGTTLVGSFGASWGMASREYFGFLAYALYVSLIGTVVHFYRYRTLDARKIEILVSSILLFFTLLIFQALVVSGEYQGSFGESFVRFTTPFVGIFGTWLFWLAMTLVAAVILSNKSVKEIVQLLLPKKELFKSSSPESSALSVKNEATIQNKEEKLPWQEEEASTAVSKSHTSLEEKLQSILPDDEGGDFQIKRHAPTKTLPTNKIVEKPIEAPSKIAMEEIEEELEEDFDEEENEDFEISQEETLEEITPPKSHAIVINELEENKKLLQEIEVGKLEKPKDFMLPPLEFLHVPSRQTHQQNEGNLDLKIKNLMDKLHKFRIEGDVIRTYTGPVVSTFEFKPSAHIKVSKILTLQDDLAMALKARTIRIQAPIPGKDVIGIEIPNEEIETIYLRDVLESEVFMSAKSPLTIALGQDIVGKAFVTDLKKLPHLLIAGTTGSGKSVGINAMILSLLYRNSPNQLRLMMIDPKMLEFSIYNDIPHLLTPVITQPKQAIAALNNMVGEMERRYKLMSESKTKNIDNFNEKVKREGREPLPYIVVVIDELADLMMTSGKEVEYSIGRLAQMARASGIHLIVATQRPSVDVVTGLIKANLPSRISYKVGQKVDSKVILDAMGAESLLGRGDMLFTPPGTSGLVRLHAPWSSEEEIEKIVDFLKEQRPVQYDQRFLQSNEGDGESSHDFISTSELDPLYEEAKKIILTDQKTSISYLQRRLQIGYNRAATIIEQMEAMGVVTEPNAKGNREIA